MLKKTQKFICFLRPYPRKLGEKYRRRLRRVIAAPTDNLRVLREHLHLPKPCEVKFKARIIAVKFQAHAQKLAGSEQ